MKIQSQRAKTKHSLASLALPTAKIVTLIIVILIVKIATQTIFQTLMENYKHVKNVIVHVKNVQDHTIFNARNVVKIVKILLYMKIINIIFL